MWLQFRANFADRYSEMRMRRVHLRMRTEGIKAFSKRIRRCSVNGENDTIRAKQLRFRLKWPYLPFNRMFTLMYFYFVVCTVVTIKNWEKPPHSYYLTEYSIHGTASTSLPYDYNYVFMYLGQLGVLLIIGMMETLKLTYLQFILWRTVAE